MSFSYPTNCMPVGEIQNNMNGQHEEQLNNLCSGDQEREDAEERLNLLSDFIDDGEEMEEELEEEEDESDNSDPESPSIQDPSVAGECSASNENGEKTQKNNEINGNTTTKKRRRKKIDPNKRKKIRKMFTEDKLNTDTLLAMKEEESRMKRIEEQAHNRVIQQPKITQRYQNNTTSHSYLASLLGSVPPTKTPSTGMPSLQPPPIKKSADVICISSDSEEEEEKSAINISSDSDDDVICTGEVQNEEREEMDVNNCGMHVEDSMNQPDDQGRVLVNVNRPPTEPEIFLSPQLARSVLPHQIGGIRFMFDNIVESLTHFEKSPGFGCILAHSMGLGKTLQVISFIDIFLRYTTARTVLCVVPVNTLMNWVSEFEMWLPTEAKSENSSDFSPRPFRVHLLCDNHKNIDSRSKVVSEWYTHGGVLLLGYEMYRLLTSRKPRKKKAKKPSKSKSSMVIDVEEEDRLSSLSAGMQDSLLQPGPDLIICDEGHRIKNSHASISQMLKNVKTRRRVVLTGYPLQNNLIEYWCMVDFVRPNFLGTRQEFSNMFERPISNGQCKDSTVADVRLMRFRSHVLHSLLKGFVQRRSHSVLQKTLPHKEEHVLMIRLSQWQKKLYNTFIKQKMEGGSGNWCSSANPIKAFSVCCKIWNHPDVLHRTVLQKTDLQSNGSELLDADFDLPDLNVDSPSRKLKQLPKTSENPTSLANTVQTNAVGPFSADKPESSLDWAKELLTGYTPGKVEFSGKMVVLMKIINSSIESGDKILVFSQSLSTLSLIEEFLSNQYIPFQDPHQISSKWCKNESYFRLDGNTHSADREKMINQFNNPENKKLWLFLLSTRAGCLGINLIGANRVVVFDASWNPCHDAQAVCRVYRYGQQKTCHIYRLVSDQSMEKKIYDRQISKQGMSDRVVDKLNPTQVFSKQDAVKLMEYSDIELPPVDLSDLQEFMDDPVLLATCQHCGHWLTKKPFFHESLLLDCKNQRLTKAEKRAAQKSYERDKLASAAYNYSRPSYANFYSGKNGSSQPPTTQSSFLPRNKSSTFPSNPKFGQGTPKPIANVRPMQSTPMPMKLQPNQPNGQTPGGNMWLYQKAGIRVQKVVATESIPLPPNPASDTPGGRNCISAGETIWVIQGKKGTYIRTYAGRIFAVRPNDAARFTRLASPTQPDNNTLMPAQGFVSQPTSQPSFKPNNPFPTSNQFPTSTTDYMSPLPYDSGPSYTQAPMYMGPSYPNINPTPSTPQAMHMPSYMSEPNLQNTSSSNQIPSWSQSDTNYDFPHHPTTSTMDPTPLVSQDILDDLLSR
uniref:helicase ARIP4 n=1 Tax=Ciona intestinalis TaxID=7719 RepID=UPI00052120AF|nr:helicase ARIP4 [Ciona intestinalis]|eukprot:XP_004226079.2 helicase ARIP4 [Ciona intestinalis]